MARKKIHEEHENHERWLVSYADFITLLFAFFVVMYALSSVNEGKYRVLSDSLESAFQTTPKSADPIQVGENPKEEKQIQLNILEKSPKSKNSKLEKQEVDIDNVKISNTERDSRNLSKIQRQLERSFGNMMESDQVSLKRTGRGIEVEISSSILFDSGSALIQPQAVPVLTDVAATIKNFPNAVRVEGFTDDVPIETDAFPSNWELSAGRAASVVHILSDEGVDPFRLAAIGYGEYRPIAANTTVEGRLRNRRVLLVILSEAAEKLYNLDNVIELAPEQVRQQNIDLDAPPEIIEMPVMTDTESVPEGLPQDLPLRARGGQSADSKEQDRLINILDSLESDTIEPSNGDTR